MSVASEIRELAREIERISRESPSYPMVWPVVQNFIGHLTAIARVSEMTHADQNRLSQHDKETRRAASNGTRV